MSNNIFIESIGKLGLTCAQLEAIGRLYGACFGGYSSYGETLCEMQAVAPDNTIAPGMRMGKVKRNIEDRRYRSSHPVKVRFHRTLSDYADNIEKNGLLRQTENYGRNTGDTDAYEPVIWTANNPNHIPVLRRYGNDEARFAPDIETFRITIPKDKYYAMKRKKFLNGRTGEMVDAVGNEESMSREGRSYAIDVFAEDIPPEYLTKMKKDNKRAYDGMLRNLLDKIIKCSRDPRNPRDYLRARSLMTLVPSSYMKKFMADKSVNFAQYGVDSKDLLDKILKRMPRTWFDYIGDFHEGRAFVRLNDKSNFIDTEGNLLCKQWFDFASDFCEGRAKVVLNDKSNFIDTEGDLLFNQWFDFASYFHEGRAFVRLNGKFNFIDTEGNLLCKQWFDYIGDFHEGRAKVRLNGKVNFIDTEGNLLCNQWFDAVDNFHEGMASVGLNGKVNFIDTEGNLLCKQWFDYIGYFIEGSAKVVLNGKYNFIDTEGNILCKQWFDFAGFFNEGRAEVRLNGKVNFIDTEGNILCKQWFDDAVDFHEGRATVKLNGKFNFIDTEGNLLCKQWFDDVGLFAGGRANVKLNGKENFIDTEGNIIPE